MVIGVAGVSPLSANRPAEAVTKKRKMHQMKKSLLAVFTNFCGYGSSQVGLIPVKPGQSGALDCVCQPIPCKAFALRVLGEKPVSLAVQAGQAQSNPVKVSQTDGDTLTRPKNRAHFQLRTLHS